jgi:hypothetical protein
MFKQFLTPLFGAFEKTLKANKLPVQLRSALLILFAIAILQITLFGISFLAVVVLVGILK